MKVRPERENAKTVVGRSKRTVQRRAAREIRRALSIPRARDAIGPIKPGVEVFGLTRGDFSLMDIIMHALEATGPADVVLSTWTTSGGEIEAAWKLCATEKIRTMRVLVDFSFLTRAKSYCEALRQRFGDECVRVTRNHAKFCLIYNDQWAVVIRSSMNLNENRRLEWFELSDDRAMCDYLLGFIEVAFDKLPVDWAQNTAYKNAETYHRLVDDSPVDVERASVLLDGPNVQDVRRIGVMPRRGHK